MKEEEKEKEWEKEKKLMPGPALSQREAICLIYSV